MAQGNGPEKKPVGDRIRDFINPALEDTRKSSIQLSILNENFEMLALQFPKIMESQFKKIFNQAAGLKNIEQRNEFIIQKLTVVENGAPGYAPSLLISVPVSTAFTSFSAEDIRSLPGYIKLHQTARAENVAVRLVGLLADETKSGSPFPTPAVVVIDGSKTYDEGALDNSSLYPDLPEPPANFDPKKPGDFNL